MAGHHILGHSDQCTLDVWWGGVIYPKLLFWPRHFALWTANDSAVRTRFGPAACARAWAGVAALSLRCAVPSVDGVDPPLPHEHGPHGAATLCLAPPAQGMAKPPLSLIEEEQQRRLSLCRRGRPPSMCPTRELKVGECAFEPKAHALKYVLSLSLGRAPPARPEQGNRGRRPSATSV